ncbi:hypothetical protein FXO37_08385 [Capsicum annuum]|nr:hypothetical protein FXO37_08385 [Capsicum annuum]
MSLESSLPETMFCGYRLLCPLEGLYAGLVSYGISDLDTPTLTINLGWGLGRQVKGGLHMARGVGLTEELPVREGLLTACLYPWHDTDTLPAGVTGWTPSVQFCDFNIKALCIGTQALVVRYVMENCKLESVKLLYPLEGLCAGLVPCGVSDSDTPTIVENLGWGFGLQVKGGLHMARGAVDFFQVIQRDMAYASVASFMRTMGLVLASKLPMKSLISDHIKEFLALHEKVSFLEVFLKDFEKNNTSGKMTDLEVQIKELATIVDHIIQLRLTEIVTTDDEMQKQRIHERLCDSIKQVTEEFDRVQKESSKFQDKGKQGPKEFWFKIQIQ